MSFKTIDWNDYYKQQAGGEYNYFRGSQYQKGSAFNRYQQGNGLGSMLKTFASWIVPIIKKHALPVLKSGAKAIGREALQSTSDFAQDVISGENAKVAAKKALSKSIENLKEKAENFTIGKGIKRKAKLKNLIFLRNKNKAKVSKNKDIFN